MTNDWIPSRQFLSVRHAARIAAKELCSITFCDCGAELDIEKVIDAMVEDGGWPSNALIVQCDPDEPSNSGLSEMEFFVGSCTLTPLAESIMKAYPALSAYLNEHF